MNTVCDQHPVLGRPVENCLICAIQALRGPDGFVHAAEIHLIWNHFACNKEFTHNGPCLKAIGREA